jgi:SAM-dependent methyltransferase
MNPQTRPERDIRSLANHGHARSTQDAAAVNSAAAVAGADAGERAWRDLHRRACAPYRRAGRFAWFFARGKLGHDPMFRRLLERGDLVRRPRVVDLGCGQGLLCSLLQASRDLTDQGGWPATWPEAPAARHYQGVDVMARDVQWAQQALTGLALQPTFNCGDMRHSTIPACDLVVMLDVLHYIDAQDQTALLQRARDALAPRGRLLLRVADAANDRATARSRWVDQLVTLMRRYPPPRPSGRPVSAWTALLQDLGFTVEALPMSQNLPFANVLLVADLNEAHA